MSEKSYPLKGGRPGWVYLVQMGDGPCKIGMTLGIEPSKRLQSIDQGLPYQLKTWGVAEVKDALAFEIALQNRFISKHIRREWFSLSPEDIAGILALPEFETLEVARLRVNERVAADLALGLRRGSVLL